MAFELGCRVRVVGLTSQQHHNGKTAAVCADFNESTGRYSVILDEGLQISIKPLNLVHADAAMRCAVADASVADIARMSIAACLNALQSIDDATKRRARTVEVHKLMAAQWCKDSRYKNTMAKHLVEDVHLPAPSSPSFLRRSPPTHFFSNRLSGASHVSLRIQERFAEISNRRRG